ncbi:MAG: hypothetical protein D6753_18755 [Planctomycetota bacterium]|nr:MAG: hypothetical protein D6753_18755 [Planctomycetota bacterium]
MNASDLPDPADCSDRPREPWERELERCLHGIPVPPGIQDRLVERLRAAQVATSLDSSDVTLAANAAGGPAAPQPAIGGRVEDTADLAVQTAVASTAANSSRSTSENWSRRATVGLVAAIAAAVLLALGGWVVWHRPATPVQLATYAIQNIESEAVLQGQWRVDRGGGPQETLRQLDTPLVLIGYQPLPPGRLGWQAYLWKYSTERGDIVYVVEIQGVPPVPGAGERLKPVSLPNQSWSVAVAVVEDRALVVCSLMDLRRWIQSGQVA